MLTLAAISRGSSSGLRYGLPSGPASARPPSFMSVASTRSKIMKSSELSAASGANHFFGRRVLSQGGQGCPVICS
jgi:hypothetical protein